jgi:glycosyltransferase involved in cell wall biosynthesis
MSRQRLKILLVTEFYPPVIKGGGEINIALIAESLASQGMQVTILTSFDRSLPITEYVGKLTIHRRLRTGNDPSSLTGNFKRAFFLPNSLKKEIRLLDQVEDYDIIHLIGATLICARYLGSLRAKVYATIESYPSLCPKGDRFYRASEACHHVCNYSLYLRCQSYCQEIGKMKNRFIIKYNLPLLTCIYWFHRRLRGSLDYVRLVSISEYVKKILKIHGHESKVIPNIIDVGKFRKASAEFSGSKAGKEKLLKISYFGTLSNYKGPQILLKAIVGLKVRCDLYGNGPLKDELLAFIKENDMDASVHEHIPYDEVPKKYAESDVIVFPSIWPEPFGRIAIEGIAAGKIVIGSKIGGIAETLNNAGIFFDPGDVGQLRDIIMRIIDDGAKCKHSKIDLDALENKYSSESIAEMLIAYYLESK